MTIRQLSLTDFRNLQSTTLDFDPNHNIIFGNNASGKTSLLESIHVICQGRSFRTPRLDDCIQHEKDGFLLFSQFDQYKSGLSRNSSETRIKINGESVNRLSRLAGLTPVKIINSDSFNLIIGTPSLKREYIDWCLFHVEHKYHQLWLAFNHALKQRNALLRNKKNNDQLDYWDKFICQYSSDIYDYRSQYIKHLSRILENEVGDLIDDLDITMEYLPGWNIKSGQSLVDLFRSNRSRDIKYGYTQFGSHRDNIILKSNSFAVKQELSRGQQKRLSIAMSICQIILVKNLTGKSVILLVDDIESELDNTSVQDTLNIIKKLGIQVFITCISISKALSHYPQEHKMFHVEHGMIRAVKKP